MDTEQLAQCRDDDLADAVGQMQALQMAAMSCLFDVINEFARRDAYRVDGSGSMVDWLVAKLGVARSTAADMVKIAGRLQELPILAGMVAEGGLSMDKLKAAVELATPETDGEVTDKALSNSAAYLQLLVRRSRRVRREDDERRRRERSFWWRWDKERGMLAIHGRLPDMGGAALVKVLERMATQMGPDPVTGEYGPVSARYADALVALAGQHIAQDGDPDRAMVVVHADAETLSGELDSGVQVSSATVQRLLCNGRVQLVFDGRDGQPVGVGRAMRTPPAWLERLVRHRDGNQCRIPGCGVTSFLQIHHLRDWAKGGRTDASHLAAACTRHHEVIHREGWVIEGDANGTLEFYRDGKRLFESRPPRLRSDVRQRTLDPFFENLNDTG
jgi:hypothetical protein